MSLSELIQEFSSAIARGDVEKARDLSKAFDGQILPSGRPVHDLLCLTLTNENPEICNEHVVSKIIENGAPVNFLCSHGLSPLFHAVAADKTDIVKLLLKKGGDPNTVKKPILTGANEFFLSGQLEIPNGFSLLHIAAHNKNEEIVKLLLECGVKPTIDEFSRSPLHCAAMNGSLPIVTAILNSECEISLINLPDSRDKLTPIHLAVINNHEDIVSLLLQKGQYDNIVSNNGYTSFYSAAVVGNQKIIELLLTHEQVAGGGKSTTGKNKEDWLEGYIAMYLAAFHGHAKVVKMFLDLGVDPNANFKDYLTPLHAAVQGGHKDIVKLLLDNGANVNPKGKKGDIDYRIWSPLLQAVLRGHEDIVELLLNSGADLHAKLQSVDVKKGEVKSNLEKLLTQDTIIISKAINGFTLIHCAAGKGYTAIVKLLLKHGADVNAKCLNNNTALAVAIVLKNEETVACLLEAGVDVEAGVRQPFFLAIKTRNFRIVELLFKYMDPLKVASSSFLEGGHTPLQCAVSVGSLEIVQFLLKKGASVIEKNKGCWSLVHSAIVKRLDKKIIKSLVECGADVTEIVKGFLPIEFLICRAVTDHEKEIRKGNTEHILDNKEIVTTFELILEHGSPLTKPEFCHAQFISPFVTAIRLGYFPGVKLLINYDIEFERGLKDLRRIFSRMFDRLSRQFVHNAKKVESEIFNLESPDNNRQILSYPRMFDDLFPNIDFAEFRQECEKFRKVARIMTQAVARMEGGGMKIEDDHFWLLSRTYAQSFFELCREEIKEMKNTVISGRVTCFDLLKANEKRLTFYARNEDIIEAIQGMDFGKRFPLYSDDLKHQLKRGVNKNNLLEMSFKILNKAFETKIPFYVACEIFEYLSSIDLRNLCRIYNPYIFVSADGPNV